jgi:hypothetical protein
MTVGKHPAAALSASVSALPEHVSTRILTLECRPRQSRCYSVRLPILDVMD